MSSLGSSEKDCKAEQQIKDSILNGFVCVHCGVGRYGKNTKLSKLVNQACKQAKRKLEQHEGSSQAACAAVMVLEDSPLCNAGTGSNLTWDGAVQCDAAIMQTDSQHDKFGAVAAVQDVKNPIKVATMLMQNANVLLAGHRVPPTMLCGEGAWAYAKHAGLKVSQQYGCQNNHLGLITQGRLKQWKLYRQKIAEAVDQQNENIGQSSKQHNHIKSSLRNQDSNLDIRQNKSSIVQQYHSEASNSQTDGHIDYNANVQLRNQARCAQETLHSQIKQPVSSSSPYIFKRCKSSLQTESQLETEQEPQLKVCYTTSKASEQQSETPTHKQVQKNSNSCTQQAIHALKPPRSLDTVGCIVVDHEGGVSASVSSGGIALKHPGRVGSAACYGASIWVEKDRESSRQIGVSVSGVGERIISRLLASRIGTALLNSPNQSIQQVIKDQLLDYVCSTLSPNDVGVMAVRTQRVNIDTGASVSSSATATDSENAVPLDRKSIKGKNDHNGTIGSIIGEGQARLPQAKRLKGTPHAEHCKPDLVHNPIDQILGSRVFVEFVAGHIADGFGFGWQNIGAQSHAEYQVLRKCALQSQQHNKQAGHSWSSKVHNDTTSQQQSDSFRDYGSSVEQKEIGRISKLDHNANSIQSSMGQSSQPRKRPLLPGQQVALDTQSTRNKCYQSSCKLSGDCVQMLQTETYWDI